MVNHSEFQRHSVTIFSDGTTPINRKEHSLHSGSFFSPFAISLTEDFPANSLTTSPRLMTSCFGSRATRCQLINARQTPASFAEIHVPPVGSRGKITRRLARSTIFGGKAVDRSSFSSRFIAR